MGRVRVKNRTSAAKLEAEPFQIGSTLPAADLTLKTKIGLTMKFAIQHQRSIAGNDITVGIEAEGDQIISRVTTTLDGFDLGDDELDAPCASYERQFLQAGDASPHREHELIVTVTDTQGKTVCADRRWEDT
jgi:hypothetical protein